MHSLPFYVFTQTIDFDLHFQSSFISRSLLLNQMQ